MVRTSNLYGLTSRCKVPTSRPHLSCDPEGASRPRPTPVVPCLPAWPARVRINRSTMDQVDFEAATLAVTRVNHGTPATHPADRPRAAGAASPAPRGRGPVASPVRQRAQSACATAAPHARPQPSISSKAPAILDQTMGNEQANPRHKIETIRELRATAAGAAGADHRHRRKIHHPNQSGR
jgi:hypothetical protein